MKLLFTATILFITGLAIGFSNPVQGFQFGLYYPNAWYGTILCFTGLIVLWIKLYVNKRR